MIISASRRTDIPTLYSEWFFNRIRDGFVNVRNPINFHQISKISLSPEVVDGIVFWTKNPRPMLRRLNELSKYTYYFQFTLNPYGLDAEPNVPNKNNTLIPTFQELADMIGAQKVIWRYDPIVLSKKYTIDYHKEYFEKLAKKLAPFTRKCTFSFLDSYKSTVRNTKDLDLLPITENKMREIAGLFQEIANAYNLKLETCAEKIDLDYLGISHAHCIDQNIFEALSGNRLILEKDKNQRPECGCMASIDIGMYNTCVNGCKYCYANYNHTMATRNHLAHNPKSSLIIGEVSENDRISVRQVASCKDCAFRLFEE